MIDIAALLEPIAPDSPSGDDLSFSSEFDAVQEARRSDDPSLDQGEWVTDIKSADWPAVTRQCSGLLQTRTKDLRLASWLAEAATHMDGFAGLADGYRLTAGLCERFWDSIHPQIEDDDLSLREGNLRWLLSQSAEWIRSIPLTDAPDAHYTAVDLEFAARGRAGAELLDHPDGAKIDAARGATPFEFYQRLAVQAPQAREALEQLQMVVDARLGQDGPSFSAVRNVLDEVCASALRMAAAAGVSATDGENQASEDATGVESRTATTATDGSLATRRDALLQLQRVAEFFRRTEPHSPVAYLVERAARWGNMPLHVWLKSVLKDGQTLAQLQELLDVPIDGNSDQVDA